MTDIVVGSVSVGVVPDARGWDEKMRQQIVEPSRAIGDEAGTEMGKAITDKMGKSGDSAGGAFDKEFKRRIKAALDSLPKAQLDADSTQLDQRLDGIRVRIKEIYDSKLIDPTKAAHEIDRIMLDLKRLKLEAGKDMPLNISYDSQKALDILYKLRGIGPQGATKGGLLSTISKDVSGLENAANSLSGATSAGTGIFGSLSSLFDRFTGFFGGGGGGGGAGGVAGEVASGGESAGMGLSGLLTSPAAITAMVAAGIAVLPFILQAAGSIIIGTMGTGILGLGIIGAQMGGKLAKPEAHFGADFSSFLKQSGAPLVPVLTQILNFAGSLMKTLTPTFVQAMKDIAPAFQQFADAFIKALMQPGVQKAIIDVANAFGLMLQSMTTVLASNMASFAKAIDDLANTIAKNPQVFADMINFLSKAVVLAIDIVNWGAKIAGYIEKHPLLEAILKWTLIPGYGVVKTGQAAQSRGGAGGAIPLSDQWFNNLGSSLWHGLMKATSTPPAGAPAKISTPFVGPVTGARPVLTHTFIGPSVPSNVAASGIPGGGVLHDILHGAMSFLTSGNIVQPTTPGQPGVPAGFVGPVAAKAPILGPAVPYPGTNVKPGISVPGELNKWLALGPAAGHIANIGVMIGHGFETAYNVAVHGMSLLSGKIAYGWNRYVKPFFTKTIPQNFHNWFFDAIHWLEKTGEDLITGLWNGVTTIWNTDIVPFFTKTIPQNFTNWFWDAIHWLEKTGSDIITGMWNGIKTAWTTVSNFFTKTIPQNFSNWFSNAVTWLTGAGKDIVNGLLAGVSDFFKGASSVNQWFHDNVYMPILTSIKSVFGISSPAKKMHPIGANLITGIIHGMMGEGKKIGHFIAQIFGSWPHAILSYVSKGLLSEKGLPKAAMNAIGSALGWGQKALKGGLGAAANILGGFWNFITGKSAGKVGAGVEQWRNTVLKALAITHLPSAYTDLVLRQMQTESGGDPNIVNTWDSNARAGNPSRGLMQTTGTTFAAFHVPGTSWDIYDPLANIAAALNYAVHTRGVGIGPGRGQLGGGSGYDLGGWLPPGVTMAVNRTGKPEAIFTQDQLDRMGGTQYHAHFDGLTGAVIEGHVQTAFKLMEMRNGALQRQGRRS